MNKTVTINLSGIVFHIDENAFQKLQSYLNTIRGFFSESEGRDEIMADIENRIAEMLSGKITDQKQVVQINDIDYIISIMGKPEEFADEKTDNEETTNKKTTNQSTHTQRKRIFRDSDNKILGGVCSGISNYFNIDPLWLRLILALMLCLAGTGFLLYIILWIVIPEAKTAAEKLEMNGEDVNYSNIGKKVEEEMKSFGKKMESWGEEVKNGKSVSNFGAFLHKFFDLIGTIIIGFLKVFSKLVGIFLIIIGIIFIIAMLSSIVGGTKIIHINNFYYSASGLIDNLFANENHILIATLALILLIGIPILMLVYRGFKLLLGVRGKNKLVSIFAGILWATGLVLFVMSAMNIYTQFVEDATTKQSYQISKTHSDTLYLRVKKVNEWNNYFEPSRKHEFINFKKHLLVSSDSANIYFGFPTLDIVRGESDSIEVVVYNNAYGSNKKEAIHLSHTINYELFQKDSLIELMPYFSIPRGEKWRNQNVHVEIRLPKGKIIYLSKSMRHLISDIKNETDTYDGDMVGRHWIMGDEELKCINCSGLELKHKRRKYRLENFNSEENMNKIPAIPDVPKEPELPSTE